VWLRRAWYPSVFSLYLLVLAVGVCLGGVLLGFGELLL
jgi:hypothetical protein